ncbi:hypothetical protein B5G12_13015 [Faecalibacterium sp. An58]|nr:hypothetical protein B5G12_13015 [Faecalibacterium sp. An58]
MATIKHTSSKNSDLSAAERYLTFQHNEYTSLPTLNTNVQQKSCKVYLHDVWFEILTCIRNIQVIY